MTLARHHERFQARTSLRHRGQCAWAKEVRSLPRIASKGRPRRLSNCGHIVGTASVKSIDCSVFRRLRSKFGCRPFRPCTKMASAQARQSGSLRDEKLDPAVLRTAATASSSCAPIALR